ncbi:LysM peptidoglycan-binding domain-containing protein [Clostridium chromiireducens]|uniref:LysM peptidoglycan-binding domain-containing protein n=1 Tax=Clostridium chromiireducens TaxID=225345 RepID=A0A964W4I6_9CLOT|nr:N-acetylmuramoyl-L-alanine amidase [Clostridium chromiireducens]MVX66576.1 LysM peptidoglycan-binding domain-containing protein [Clostridium chromiireducens]
MSKINTIAIDFGHNVNFDIGAVGIRKEDELNKLVGETLIEKFRGAGINVVNCTPSNATSLYDSLNQRCIVANNSNADFFISIHHNAGGGEGAEVLCYDSGIAEEVGNIILSQLANIGIKDRGVKIRRDLFIINRTRMKAILVECAFVDSELDMSNYDYNKVSGAIFQGVCNKFGIGVNSDGIDNINTNSNGSEIGEVYHTVVNGESLSRMSNRYDVSMQRLVDMNDIKDKNLIFVGQKIRIK